MLQCPIHMAKKSVADTEPQEAAVAPSEVLAEVDIDTDEARIYEVGYHIIPTVEEADLESIVGGIRAIIERSGGSFIAEGAPENIALSYPISIRENGRHAEYDRAYFGWLKFEAPGTSAVALDAALKTNKEILRHIVFRTVREDTRARIKLGHLREVRRTDTLKPALRRTDEVVAPVSEAEIDKAIEELTTE